MTIERDVDAEMGGADAAAFVDDLCARDTLAARTRMLLLRLEKQGHKLGWGHSDVSGVFQVHHNPRTGHVESHWSYWVSDSIRRLLSRNGGELGAAFLKVADTFEQMAAGKLEHKLPPAFRGRYARKTQDGDLWRGERPGWRFYGYGVRSESWIAPAGADADSLHSEGRLHEHPQLSRLREVIVTARDGLVWFVGRREGEKPEVKAYMPESDTAYGDPVSHALSRMTNVVAGNPVPIAPR